VTDFRVFSGQSAHETEEITSDSAPAPSTPEQQQSTLPLLLVQFVGLLTRDEARRICCLYAEKSPHSRRGIVAMARTIERANQGG